MSNKSGGYEPPETENFKFFSHRQCEYFPCHELKGNKSEEDFNCLFCYCPLYLLGRHCGGSFIYNQKGIKVCTNCLYPHKRENYRAVTRKAFSRMRRVISLVDKASPEDPS